MKGWKEVSVSEIGRVITGNTPPRKSPELYGDHTIFIKPTDVTEGEKYTYEPEECYSELGFRKYKGSLIPKGSTCVVTIGSIGKKMTKAHCDCFINQAMNAVVPFPEYDEEFVYYVLRYNLAQLKGLDSGTASGRENVSKSSFSSIKLTVPTDKTIQTKIGRILSTYDDLIENNLKRIKLLEELAQRTYEEWFVKFRVNGEALEVDEETGLPVGWERKKLRDILLLNYGKALKADSRVHGSIPVYGSSGIVGYHNSAIVSGPGIVLGRKGNVGSVFWSEKSFFPIDTVYYVTSDYSNYFLYFNLKAQNFINNDAAVPGLNRNAAYMADSFLPTSHILEEFTRIVKPQFDLVENLKSQNYILKECREILLPYPPHELRLA